jgi:superfamily II DNA helicase RecQ
MKIVSEFISGKDVFVILPTGYGKSLCFFCLPKSFDILRKTCGSIVVVITPLIAIMEDMTTFLNSKSLTAAHLSQDMSDNSIRQGVIDSQYQMVFFSPKAILSPRWRNLLLYHKRLVGMVVDEAHTICSW